MKLNSSIPSNSVKLIEIYNKVVSDTLITGPDFQRKLVWKKQHKIAFIQTILMNFPFPEIYIASSEMDIQKLQAKEILVDGQQRVTAIVDYIQGRGDFSNTRKVVAFEDLAPEQKKDFLNYLISVKDLKDLSEEMIYEVFKRINSTDYSLNSYEKLNATFGGGEFAIFCKILADKEYNPTDADTDIVIEADLREKISNFFINHNVFTDNDVKRMFDLQFIMLLVSTILEGRYFGRNSKISEYLSRYNHDFGNYKDILAKIANAIDIISGMKLSKDSYWFNKPNLFSLIIELKDLNIRDLDLERLEFYLNELESKVDIYFNGDEDDLKLITADESRYFEVARQGSNELSSRTHRGAVLNTLIQKSNIREVEQGESVPLLSANINKLKDLSGVGAIVNLSETGLTKRILDATLNFRSFLKENSLHDYDGQEYGPGKKVKIDAYYKNSDGTEVCTELSMYRSNSRGDYRFWFSGLNEFAVSGDILAIIYKNSKILVLNISRQDYGNILN